MGKIKDIIFARLQGMEILSKEDFDTFASSVENDIKPLFKVNMPKVSMGKDKWLDKEETGVVVKVQGKNSEYTLKGGALIFFCMLYAAYGYKHGKNEAAGAYVSTIILGVFDGLSNDGKNELSADIIRAAKRANETRDPERGTPKMLQGWITAKRWED